MSLFNAGKLRPEIPNHKMPSSCVKIRATLVFPYIFFKHTASIPYLALHSVIPQFSNGPSLQTAVFFAIYFEINGHVGK